METRDRKYKRRSEYSIKDKLEQWLAKSPKLEKLVDQAAFFLKHPDKFSERINEVFNQATNKSEHNSLIAFGKKTQALYRMVKMSYSGEYKGISKGQLYLGLAGLVYLISPIDLIPDFLPVIGFIDDAAFMLWLIKKAADELEKFEAWEQAQGMASSNNGTVLYKS